jgi:thiol-disulfide isomerase/thioredoxin
VTSTVRQPARVRAPELKGRGGWLNTGGEQLTLVGLRGKIVLLDFWTYCCVNCLHLLEELRPVEQKYSDVLVVIGVHSPKFAHEAEHAAVVAAVERYSVHHPVLDDPELATWQQYAVRAWPTVAIIDPEGYVVAQLSGEGHGHAIDALLTELVAEHDARGTLHRGSGPYVAPPPSRELLLFPSKVLVLADSTLLVADTAHHGLVWLEESGTEVLHRVGDGSPGWVDGPAAAARFNEPGGMARLPAEVSARVGYDVVVADTVNHVLRGVDTVTWTVTTVAGTGSQWMRGDPTTGPATSVALSSPWDVAWFEGALIVANAGVHRLDRLDLVAATLAPYAGTTQEGLVDGDRERAWFAQPSGLATSTDGETLWLVDAETSALRRIRNGVVTTEIGAGLFEFGHVDGPAETALLQHPLGLALLPDGSIAIADTYNGAVRRFDPVTREVSTLATGLDEPSDVVTIIDSERGSVLLVVESGAHRIIRIPLPDNALQVPPTSYRMARPVTELALGALELLVEFVPPPGQHLDDRYGPATHLVISSSPPELLAEGAGSGAGLSRLLRTADTGGFEGVLHVSVRVASCDDPDAPDATEFPACHIHQQDWGIPVRIDSEGASSLSLVLASR